MTGFVKQWLWALSWLAIGAVSLLLGWKFNLPWLAASAVLTGPLAPLTPLRWRADFETPRERRVVQKGARWP